MANLYGRLQGNRGEATRCGSDHITAKVETWEGAIRVDLTKDGEFVVYMGEKHSPRQVIASGNLNDKRLDPRPDEI